MLVQYVEKKVDTQLVDAGFSTDHAGELVNLRELEDLLPVLALQIILVPSDFLDQIQETGEARHLLRIAALASDFCDKSFH